MANSSILAAFERMWQHVVYALNNKSDISHTHEIDWENETKTDGGYIANKPSIKKGTGNSSVVIGTGDAQGDFSVAGGTNDSSLVSNMIGSLGSLANIEQPIAQGDMSLSFGAGTKTLTAGTIAMGANTTAGCKGFYFWSIDFANKVITLSTNQKPIILGSRQWTDAAKTQLEKWAKDDVISIVNNHKYVLCSKITAIDATNGTITVDSLPFTEVDSKLSPSFDDYAVTCPSKPATGVIELGLGAFAIGLENKASGSFSHVEGWNNLGTGDFSHVEGRDNKAGYSAHAEGKETSAIGSYSHTEGQRTQATATGSHAEGEDTVASGYQAHAEGNKTNAIGGQAHAEGGKTKALGNFSHSQGYQTVASGNYAHAQGKSDNLLPITIDGVTYDHTTDNDALIKAWKSSKFSLAKGNASHVEGLNCLGLASISHAEGNSTIALASQSHAEGNETITHGTNSHAEGNKTTTFGNNSHIEGTSDNTTESLSIDKSTSTEDMLAIWQTTKFAAAHGAASHVEGKNNLGLGVMSHVEGENNITQNYHAHAEGYNNIASGDKSHVEGANNIAIGKYQHVQGKWNKVPDEADKNKYAHIVGGGTSDTDRKNVHTLDWNGNAVYTGSVTATDFITQDGVSILTLLGDIESLLAEI